MSLPEDLSCLQGGGGAEHAAALATLEKQLICPICLELFNKPVVILPCQHNLCRKCANELYQPSLFQARTTMMVNSGRFRCPSCRHDVVLDRHGVYGLQRNLLVENIIDVYKQEVSNNNNAKSPLPLPPSPTELSCSDHEGEKVNIYCLTCQVPTCSLCKVFGAHQTCQVAPLMDVYKQQKDELSEGLSSLLVVNDRIQAAINELEETCTKIEENCEAQKQSVCDKFNHMISILKERHKVMTQQISSEQDEKTGHAQALVRCYGDSVADNTKLIERATSSMEELDMSDFVQNSRELITKVIAATGSCPTETLKPGYENLSPYRLNFSRQERALKSLDFIKVVEDVLEEPDVEPEPEETDESSAENTESKHYQGTSTQNLQPDVEPVIETVPALISPPEEPAMISLVPELLGASVDPVEAELQLETAEADDERVGQMKEKEEEDEDEAEPSSAPDDVKEANVCEEQEGMSTQQCEGGGAESGAGGWTAERETGGEPGARFEEGIQMTQGADVMFYPAWYKPVLPHTRPPCCPPPQTLQQAESPSQKLPPPHESNSQDHEIPVESNPVFTAVPQMPQNPGDAGTVAVETKEGVIQGWASQHETGDDCHNLVGGDFNLRDIIPDDSLISLISEGSSPELDKDMLEPGAGRAEDAEEREKLEEDALGLNGASQMSEKGFRDKDEMMEKGSERLNEGSEVIRWLERGDVALTGREKRNSSMQGDDVCSASPGNEQEDVENNDQPEDLKSKMETDAESEVKINSCVSLQAVTLLFYLLACLVILQRVWVYIGCFICT